MYNFILLNKYCNFVLFASLKQKGDNKNHNFLLNVSGILILFLFDF